MRTTTRLPPAYWRLCGAAGINSVGTGAFTAAMPLLAVTLTDDARLVSVLSAAAFLPWLLLSLPAGALVDRHDRVTLMWWAQAGQAVLTTAVAVLAATGHASVATLAALTLGVGACEVVVGIAAQAVLPDLVAPGLLHRANGHQQAITTVGQFFLGPPLGSVLFAVAVGLPFGLDAASYALSAALLASLPRRPRPAVERHPPVRAAIADGMRWLWRHRLMRTLALLLGVNTFCFQLANATLVLFATRTLGLDARGYGLLLAGAAVGSVVGGLVNGRLVERIGVLPAIVASMAANAVLAFGMGLSPNAAVLAVVLAGNGFAITLWNVVTVSLRQQAVPAELFGRVNSGYRMIGWGLIPLGAVCAGLLAHTFGLRAPYPVAGTIRAAALLVALPVLVRAIRDTEPRPA